MNVSVVVGNPKPESRNYAGALAGVIGIPLMLGGAWQHALAGDLLLKPVLVELGATCPTQGLFLLDRDYEDSTTLTGWLETSRPQIGAIQRS